MKLKTQNSKGKTQNSSLIARQFCVLSFAFCLLTSISPPAAAIPVQKPFGDFPKAILFTGTAKPDSAVPIIVADGNSGSITTQQGFIMTPLGDGSWAVSAKVYPGSTYNYYFEYRVPEFEPDSTASFRTTEPGGNRMADANRTRTVVIPASALSGYVVYNAYGDRSVWGAQGTETTFSTTNPYFVNWRGNALMTATDGDTSGKDETNNYNVFAKQWGTSKAQISWEITLGGDGLAPQIEGAKRFAPGSPPAYGFEILRADSKPNLALSALSFANITPTVTGLSIYSDNDNDPWNPVIYFYDTAVVAKPDSTFIYTVRTRNAYGMTNTETQQLTFADGYSSLTWATQAVEVDGTVDAMYGPAIATDTRGDQSFKNLDLTRMWVTRDKQNDYFALEIAGDIYKDVWGRYVILIDSTGDSLGAPSMKYSSLGANYKNIAFPGKRPEYAIVISTDNQTTGPPANQSTVYKWTGTDWTAFGSVQVASSTNGESSYIEMAFTRTAGPAPRIWIEGYSTGNSGGDPARDVINKLEGDSENNEWNTNSWSTPTTAKLSVSTPFPPALLPPLAVSATAWDTRAYIRWDPPAQNINLVGHLDIFFDSDYQKVIEGWPSVRLDSVATSISVIETKGLQAGVRYFTRVFAVSADGSESVGSAIAMCEIRGAWDTIVTTSRDSTGWTIIEIPKWARNNLGDTYFTIEILNYNELWTMAHFTDTARMIQLNEVHAANNKMFFSPTIRPISSGTFPDTLSPMRQVTVRRPDGSKAPPGYMAEVVLHIPYVTTDSVTLMGPGLMKENQLKVLKLDESGVVWSKPNTEKTQWVEYDSDKVRIVTSEFSIWTVLAGAAPVNNLDKMVVYPNPFNAADYISAGHPLPAHVTFAFIPLATERIEIFNVAGERVRTLDKTDASEFESDGTSLIAKWDAKNDYGRDVASGIYVFWIRANGQVKIGKVAIIK